MMKCNNLFRDAIVREFLFEMLGWSNDDVRVVRVVYHHGPHFGFSDTSC